MTTTIINVFESKACLATLLLYGSTFTDCVGFINAGGLFVRPNDFIMLCNGKLLD